MRQARMATVFYALLSCAVLFTACAMAKELTNRAPYLHTLESQDVLWKERRLHQDGAGDANVADNSAESDDPRERIFRGVRAEEGEFPYLVSLRSFGNHFCGGVLIAPNVVLTASHCVVTKSGSIQTPDVSVGLLGIRDTKSVRDTVEEFKTCETIVHRNFDLNRIQDGFDIALLVLDGNSTAELVEVDRGSISLQEGDPVTVAGFGRISNNELSSELLKTEELQYVEMEKCETDFRRDFPPSTMCAFDPKGSDVCRGDSGGPLLTSDKKTVVGVVSFGPPDCTDIAIPSVYTRVSSFTQFIDSMGLEDGESTITENCFPDETLTAPASPQGSSPAVPEEGGMAESIAAAIAAGDTDGAADLIIQAVEDNNEDEVVEAMELALAQGNSGAAGEAIRAAIRKGVSLQKLFPALRVLDP